jgi:hypothetical protein
LGRSSTYQRCGRDGQRPIVHLANKETQAEPEDLPKEENFDEAQCDDDDSDGDIHY